MSDTQRTLSFIWLDVFTARPLEGNQLAVFTDGRGLSKEQMQSIALETKLSETTFVIPREPEVEREKGVPSASSPSTKNFRSPAIPRWAPPRRCAAPVALTPFGSISTPAKSPSTFVTRTALPSARCVNAILNS